MNASEPLWSEGRKRQPSNLAFAFFVLPKTQRKDFEVLYRFCREVDDIADHPTLSLSQKSDQLARWRTAFLGEHPLPVSLQELLRRRHMDAHLFLEIIEGMQMDLGRVRYESFGDLRGYCWRAASAVGLLCMQIMGKESKAHREYAETLGLALQITNILRDVGEDAKMDRIYLPLEDMRRFEVLEEDIFTGSSNANFHALMRFEAERASHLYAEAVQILSAQERELLPASEMMREIYTSLLHQMRTDHFRVFEKKYRVSRLRKLAMGMRVWMRTHRIRHCQSPSL